MVFSALWKLNWEWKLNIWEVRVRNTRKGANEGVFLLFLAQIGGKTDQFTYIRKYGQRGVSLLPWKLNWDRNLRNGNLSGTTV